MQQIIHIENPCSEDWSAMTPNEMGRHCSNCCKTVVDFTNWELPEIVDYLKNRKHICGRFRNEQLDVPVEISSSLIKQIWRATIPFYRKIAAIIILFFATGFYAEAQTNKGDVAVIERPHLVGDTILVNKTKPDSSKIKTVDSTAQHPLPKPITRPVMGKPSTNIIKKL